MTNPTNEEIARELAQEIADLVGFDVSVQDASGRTVADVIATHLRAKDEAAARTIDEQTARIEELERRLKIPFGKLPCAQCGGPHNFDTSVPSTVWNQIIRAKGLPEYLCATCIIQEFVRANQGFTATLWNEEFNGVPIEVIVNGQNAQDATAIQKENNSLRNKLRAAATATGEACTCACHDDPKHQTVQDWAEANRYHVAKLKEVTAEAKKLQADVDGFWRMLHNAWDIEPREYFEKEAPTSGDWSPMAMAVHYMWKRDTKVAEVRSKAWDEAIEIVMEIDTDAVDWKERLVTALTTAKDDKK